MWCACSLLWPRGLSSYGLGLARGYRLQILTSIPAPAPVRETSDLRRSTPTATAAAQARRGTGSRDARGTRAGPGVDPCPPAPCRLRPASQRPGCTPHTQGQRYDRCERERYNKEPRRVALECRTVVCREGPILSAESSRSRAADTVPFYLPSSITRAQGCATSPARRCAIVPSSVARST